MEVATGKRNRCASREQAPLQGARRHALRMRGCGPDSACQRFKGALCRR